MNKLNPARRRLASLGMATVLLGLALSGSAAFAADPTASGRMQAPDHANMPSHMQGAQMLSDMERCKLYQRRFDKQVGAHENAAKIDEARVLRIEGGKLCAKGDHVRGLGKMKEALDNLGIDTAL